MQPQLHQSSPASIPLHFTCYIYEREGSFANVRAMHTRTKYNGSSGCSQALRKALDAERMQTKIVACDSLWGFEDELLADAQVRRAVGVLGCAS